MVDILGGAVTYDTGMVSYLAMENSFNEIASATIFSDLSTVAIGFCIVLLYVVIMLGNFLDKIENRVSSKSEQQCHICMTTTTSHQQSLPFL